MIVVPHNMIVAPHNMIVVPHSVIVTPQSMIVTPQNMIAVPHNMIVTPQNKSHPKCWAPPPLSPAPVGGIRGGSKQLKPCPSSTCDYAGVSLSLCLFL